MKYVCFYYEKEIKEKKIQGEDQTGWNGVEPKKSNNVERREYLRGLGVSFKFREILELKMGNMK